MTSIFHTCSAHQQSASPKDPSTPTPPSHSTRHNNPINLTQFIHGHSIPFKQPLYYTISYKLFRAHVGILFFRPSPRIYANPSYSTKLSIIVSPFRFEMQSFLRKLCCWRLFFISLPFFFFARTLDQRQPTAPPIRLPHPTALFTQSGTFVRPTRVYRSCVDGMPWRHFDRASVSKQVSRPWKEEAKKSIYYYNGEW